MQMDPLLQQIPGVHSWLPVGLIGGYDEYLVNTADTRQYLAAADTLLQAWEVLRSVLAASQHGH